MRHHNVGCAEPLLQEMKQYRFDCNSNLFIFVSLLIGGSFTLSLKQPPCIRGWGGQCFVTRNSDVPIVLNNALSWPWRKTAGAAVYRNPPLRAFATLLDPALSERDHNNQSRMLFEGTQAIRKENLLHVNKMMDTVAAAVSSSNYNLRAFDPAHDQVALERICKNVYGGHDYLPRLAASLANDPASSFLVLEDKRLKQAVAVANVRNFRPTMAWLEAVRSDEEHRGRGLASRLTRHIIDTCKQDGRQIFTCTVGSNTAMRRVFDKTGMLLLKQIHQLSFEKLRELPGWSRGDERAGQSILKAYGLESSISDEARAMKWITVQNERELEAILEKVRKAGGIGHLPAVYELLSDSSARDSLANGRMWKLEAADQAAVLTFSREQKITSLKSNWICSIAATSPQALESALWHAHSETCLSTLEGDVMFSLAIDGMIPVTLCQSLPLVEDPCFLFGTSCLL